MNLGQLTDNAVGSLNHFGDTWWRLVTQQTLQTSIVAAIVLLIVAFRNRLPAQWRYALLLVALVKFVVPPFYTSLPTGLLRQTPLAAFTIGRADGQSSPDQDSFALNSPGVVFAENSNSLGPNPYVSNGPTTNELLSSVESQLANGKGQQRSQASDSETLSQSDEVPYSHEVHSDELAHSDERARSEALATHVGAAWPVLRFSAISWRGWLMLVHLFGAVLLIGAAISRVVWLHRNRGLFNQRLTDLSTELARQQSLTCFPRVYVSETIGSPISYGTLWPAIVMPKSTASELDSEQTELVLLHELTHHHRQDPLVMWLQLALLSCWWFHPFIWLLNRTIQTVREECCDDFLLSRELIKGQFYCETLVRVAKLAKPRLLAPAVSMADGDRRRLAARMQRLMNANLARKDRLGWMGFVLLIVASATLLPGLPRETTGQESISQESISQESTTAKAADQKATPPIASVDVASRESDGQPRTVSGQVVDANGAAILDVRLWVAVEDPESNADGPRILGRAKSDSAGNWSLSLTDSSLNDDSNRNARFFTFAFKKGFYLGGTNFTLRDGDSKVNLQLKQGDAAKLRIDGTGNREPQGTVTLDFFRPGNRTQEPRLHLPRELKELIAVPLARNVALPWVRPGSHFGVEVTEKELGRQNVSPTFEMPSPWIVSLRPVGTVEGRIVLPDNGDVDPTTIQIRVATVTKWDHVLGHQSGSATAVPDATGKFVLERVAAGTMRFFVTEPKDAKYLCVPRWDEYVSANETTTLEMPMEKTVKITRRFVNKQTNDPVPGVRMHVSLPFGFGSKFVSDKDGIATAWIRPNQRYRDSYIPPKGFLSIRDDKPLLVSTSGSSIPDHVKLDPIQLSSARVVRGRVLDAVGNPQCGVSIGMACDDPENPRRYRGRLRLALEGVHRLVPQLTYHATTDEVGEFEFHAVSPTAKLSLTPMMRGVRFGSTVNVDAGAETAVIDLATTVSDLISLSGKVVDASGKPVRSMNVVIVVRDEPTNRWVLGNGASVKTAEDGTFETEATFPRDNRYRFFVGNNGRDNLVRSEDFQPKLAETTTAPTIRITEKAIRATPLQTAFTASSQTPIQTAIQTAPATNSDLTGKIVNSAGQPVQAQITLWHEAQTMRRRCNADGTFRFSDLKGQVAWVFIEADSYQFDGRYVTLGQTPEAAFTIYRRDEKHPRSFRTRNTAASPKIRALALQKMTGFHERLMNSSNPDRNKRKAIIALSLLDGQQALAAIERLGREAKWTYGEFVQTHEKLNPALAAQAAMHIDADPRSRQYTLASSARSQQDPIRSQILQQALEANKQTVAEGKVEGLALIADAYLEGGNREQAIKLFGQAVKIADTLPESKRRSYTLSELASRCAVVDMKTAQRLMQNLPDGRETDLGLVRMVHRCVTIDPEYATGLIAQIADERTRDSALLKASSTLAPIDHRYALKLAEQITSERSHQALAMGYIVGNSDMSERERNETMDRAFAILADVHRNRTMGAMQVGIYLLPTVEKVLPDRLNEFFWKALALRGDFSTGRFMQRLGERQGLKRLADPVAGAYLSRYSPEIAKSLTMTPGDQSIDLEYAAAPPFMLGAMATYDPEKAIRFADLLPEKTASEIEQKRVAWVEVLQMVGRTTEQRWQYLNDNQYHIWYPGKDF